MDHLTDAELKKEIAELGNRIKARRKQLNLTIDQAADRAGYDRRSFINLEKGHQKKGPSFDTIIALCAALECSPNYLFGIDDHPTVAHAGIAKLTGLSDPAIDKLLNLSPVEKGFCNALFSESDLYMISNKFQAFRIVLNTPKALIAEHPDSPLQAKLNGMELPKVAIKDTEDYTRFELSRAFINFAERGIKK